MTFLTFAIAKFKILKFQICLNETEILLSKVPKVKPKVNKVHCNWTKAKYYITKISWNSVTFMKSSNFCKISQFLIKFGKSLKDLGKILLKGLKTVKYRLNFVYFHSCTVKWPKVGQTSSITLMKVHCIQWRFSWS